MAHCLTWDRGQHSFYRKNYEYLKLLAYYKAFYFSDVYLDGILIQRQF